MSTEQNDTKYVVLMFVGIALLVLGSILIDHKLVDIGYFGIVIIYLIRYLLVIKNR